MKRILLISIVLLSLAYVARSQCTASAGFQCVPQADVDRTAKDLKAYEAMKVAYADLLKERGLSAAEREAAANALKIAGDTIAVLQKGIADREALIELQQKTLQLYADLVQKLTDQLNKPKSAWHKFVDAVREIAYIAIGIGIGRVVP